ncbi:heavy-metal-associated domain-containing protein [Leptospira mayottensis]|uniref:Heavy metal-associated domain protein n=2 Tax=Leptospira mayottensis TaxID=1137606 RepID=A0AA87MPV3_9LEPT|nr:heavy-metal-associated domain-containing protein [Leptospira mayottensis]AXR63212.1 copper chaperone [Leptospira mayottensis]AXR66970.1 copper chaperone [Leptospira mayottensis]EKS01152.1 heavy metal-associated domain protein [Leptospira mayottensis 200901122]
MKEIKLTLEGMTCSHCLRTVESALRKIGLTGKANLEKKEVVYQGEGTPEELSKIKSILTEEGYIPGEIK